MALFFEFHQGQLTIYSLNFKVQALKIQEYRLICLLNVYFKIFTKMGINRIGTVADKVIKPTQTTFMPQRNIIEGVIILHETIHELHRKKQNGVILKLDFEKAYDNVKWSFFQQTM